MMRWSRCILLTGRSVFWQSEKKIVDLYGASFAEQLHVRVNISALYISGGSTQDGVESVPSEAIVRGAPAIARLAAGCATPYRRVSL